MPDIATPNAQLEQRLDAMGSPTFSAKQASESHNHDANHFLTKGLITTKGWTLEGLVNKAPNFHPVHTVHFRDPGLLQEIRTHEDSGIPLIIQGFHEHESWPTDLFTLDWLNEHGKPGASARNVCNWSDFDLPLSELIRKLRATPIYANENDTERLYGKDAECPHEWETWLSTSGVLPKDLLPHGTNDYLNYLPSDVQTLMCYLGVGDTFTPFHKDLCASSGQNLMCYTENGGSSFWFMTASSAAPDMAEWFHKMGEELDFETHVITLEELRQSKLDIYIAEQQLGDLVLVPPRSCHQVVNNSGITMKTSWSRMTLKGLQNSLYHELPIYHRVCRPETYKVKLNIYRALHHQTRVLREFREQETCSTHSDRSSPGIESMLEQVAFELHHLLDLLDDVLGEEYSSKYQDMPHADTSHQDNITCDFCGADVFQSFFECMSCTSQSHIIYEEMKVGDGIVICPLCYIEGRSCKCGVMKPTQCRPFGDLLRTRDDALCAIRAVCANIVKDYRSLLDHPNSITSKRHVGIFTAACVLYEKRVRLSANTRMCWSWRVSHQVLHSSHIYCKPCHNGRCLAHVLEVFHTHSAPAILISEGAEGGPQNWHEYHKKSKAEFKQARARILRDEKTGERPDFRMKLAYLASKFRICTSINPTATLPGWYDDCVDASVVPSPSKHIINRSGSDLRHCGGPAISSTDGESSPTAELLFGRSEGLSDLTSLPSDYQGSPSSTSMTSKSLFTAGQLPGIPLVNGKNRRVVLDYVSLPHLQQDQKQLPASSDLSSSSMVIDHASIHSRSMSDDDDTSRPPKKQRVALHIELPRKVAHPLRLEKRVSSGAVYVTNKPRFPIESSSSSLSPVKKAVGIQVEDDTRIALQKQVDLALAENVRLKLANDVLKKDREVIESEIFELQKHNEQLTNVAQKHHAQYRHMRESYYALQQELFCPSSASAPIVPRSQQGTHSRAFYAEAPPTEPHVLDGILNEPPSTALDTQGHGTGHSFQIGMHRSFAAAPIQDMSHHSRHPEKRGSHNGTVQQPCVPGDENSPRVPDPSEARSQTGASVEGNLPLLMEQGIQMK